MADLSFTQLRARQNKRLRDEADTTFTSSEKDEFLTAAIDDPYVFGIGRDDSITTTASTASYDISSADVTEPSEVQIDMLGDGHGVPVNRTGYDIIDGTLYLDAAHRGIPSNKTLILIGKKKLTANDLIPTFLQEYVLRLADVFAMEELMASFTTRFLKNDATMGDISLAIRSHQARITDLRKNLANRREVSG